MSSSLSTERVASVLKRLFATAEASDPQVMAMVRDEAERRGNELHESPDKADLLANAYLAVPPECGLFLYVLGRSQRRETDCRVWHVFWNLDDLPGMCGGRVEQWQGTGRDHGTQSRKSSRRDGEPSGSGASRSR